MTDALAYFTAKLTYETDASDVYAAQKAGDEFVLVDVRGDEAWAQGRISGALHIPHAEGAREFAALGYAVREMIGGYEYWVREGQPTENDTGALPRTFDAQVMVVRTSS
jgi:rhodanese-related sulfurtransferase